jgi:hypothetical protein
VAVTIEDIGRSDPDHNLRMGYDASGFGPDISLYTIFNLNIRSQFWKNSSEHYNRIFLSDHGCSMAMDLEDASLQVF